VRFLPVIAIAEVRSVLPEANPHAAMYLKNGEQHD
jgi:hypothetical protein